MLDFSSDSVSGFNVKTLVRLHHFFNKGMNTVDYDMDVIIGRIHMSRHNGLMVFQAHAFQKNTDRFLHLFSSGNFIFLP